MFKTSFNLLYSLLRRGDQTCIETSSHWTRHAHAHACGTPHTTNGGNISRHIVAICTRNPARARQNARRRRDASFYLSAIYLPTRSLPKRPRRAHDPAGDRFEKLLIVPVFGRSAPQNPRDTLSFLYARDRDNRASLAPKARKTLVSLD